MYRLLGLLLLVAVPVHAQDCEVKQDEFEGTTEVQCGPVDVVVEEQPGHRIWRSQGAVVRTEERFGFGVVTNADSWNFLQVDEAHALVDGERHTFRTLNDRDVSSGSVTESVILIISTREARKIADAETVRVKIDRAVFDVSALIPLVGAALEKL